MALMLVGVVSVTAVFASSGAPPVETLPSWARPLVQFQPMYPTVQFMRALAEGGPALLPFLVSSIWALALVAVLTPLAMSGYRAAAGR